MTGPAFYAGGHLGYAWGSSNFTDSATGCRRQPFPARSIWRSRSTRSTRRQLLRRLSGRLRPMFANRGSSAPRSMRRSELSRSRRAFPSAALRRSTRRPTAPRPTARPCCRRAPCAAASAMRRKLALVCDGGFAWTYDKLSLTQLSSGAMEQPSCGGSAGGRRRRRGPGRAALRPSRISLHRLWLQQHDFPRRGREVRVGFCPAAACASV